jgi:hypothetical protein
MDPLMSLQGAMLLYAVLLGLSGLCYLGLSERLEAPADLPRLELSPESRRILWRVSALFGLDSLAGGFLVFLAVTAILLSEGALLRYPLEHAGALILLIEAGLTLSLGLILAGLFLVLAWHPASPSESAGEESKSCPPA